MVQHNHSRSGDGVVRGMRFQIGQGVAKLVRAAAGRSPDELVDLRRGSPNWLPRHRAGRGRPVPGRPRRPGRRARDQFRDPDLRIDWPIPETDLVASARDLAAPTMRQIADGLPFVDLTGAR